MANTPAYLNTTIIMTANVE